jgi:hypothetical protein
MKLPLLIAEDLFNILADSHSCRTADHAYLAGDSFEAAANSNLVGSWRCGGAGGDVGEGWQAQVSDRRLESGIELSQLVLGAGQTDLKAFNLAEPALALSFGDPIDQVVPDLDQPVSLGRLGPQKRASDASVLVNA